MHERQPQHWAYSKEYLQILRDRTPPCVPEEHAVLCVTGGLAKRQLTPASDLDLLALLSQDAPVGTADYIRDALHRLDLPHPLEFYPFETTDAWLWMAEHSQLFASDLLYAQPVAGDPRILKSTLDTVRQRYLDERNQYSYFVYNLLYRDRQVRNASSVSLKYMRGGLRDLDLLRWVSRRIVGSQSNQPRRSLAALAQKNILRPRDADFLASYTDRALTEKWRLGEEADTTNGPCLDGADRVWQLAETVKERVLTLFAERKGKPWISAVRNARSGILSSSQRSQMLDCSDESMAFCALWDADDPHMLEDGLRQHQDFWLVRAAVALNHHTPTDLLDTVERLRYCDMDDIHLFITRTRDALRRTVAPPHSLV